MNQRQGSQSRFLINLVSVLQLVCSLRLLCSCVRCFPLWSKDVQGNGNQPRFSRIGLHCCTSGTQGAKRILLEGLIVSLWSFRSCLSSLSCLWKVALKYSWILDLQPEHIPTFVCLMSTKITKEQKKWSQNAFAWVHASVCLSVVCVCLCVDENTPPRTAWMFFWTVLETFL